MITEATKAALNTAASLQFGVIRGQKLTDWENSFLADTLKRWDRFGDKLMISEKQAAIIDRIAAKAH